MVVNKKRILYNILILSSFLVLSLISVILLFHTHNLFGAGDMQFHLKRIAELEASFKHGNLLPSYSFNQFHGSAVMSLYPYLNLVPIILLSVFIKSNIALIYVFFGLNVLISLMVSYYSSLNLSRSKGTSFLFSIVYSLSTPFLTYGFYNMDLGALTSVAIFPLVVFGFFNLVKRDKWLELSIGVTLLIYSHVLSTAIIIGLLLLLLFINLFFNHKQILNKYFWWGICKSVVLSILLTSIVWLPVLKFGLNNLGNTYPPTLGNLNKIYLIPLINYGIRGYITYNLGIIAIAGAILPIIYKIYRIITKNKRKLFNKYTKQMYGIAIFVILICRFFPLNLTTHGILKVFMIFQFTWRFYIIPELFLSYVFAVCIVKCVRHKLFRQVLFVLCIIVAIGFQFLGQGRIIHESINSPAFSSKYVTNRTYTQKNNLHHKNVFLRQFHFTYYKNPRYPYYKLTNEAQLNRLISTYTDENAPDYYPTNSLSKLNYVNNNKATYGHNQTINVEHTGYNQFSFNSPKKINRLALPLLHYNGEHLRVYVNHHLVHSHANGDSLVTLDNVKKGRSVVSVKSMPNGLLEALLFGIGVIWLILTVLREKYRNFTNFVNRTLNTKYFCFIFSLFITLIILIPFLLNMSFTNVLISIIDISIISAPYCLIVDIFMHIIRFDINGAIYNSIKKFVKEDRVVKYFHLFNVHFNRKFTKHKLLNINVLPLFLSSVFEVFVISMINMSYIITKFNIVNKYINNKYMLKITDSYALYFMSWMILGMALLFILSIIYYKEIKYTFMELWPKVIVSSVSIIGVMLTALSTVHKGALTQSISYNFSIMFIYLMTPICIVFIDLIHIYKMRKQHKLDLLHENSKLFLKNNKDTINK